MYLVAFDECSVLENSHVLLKSCQLFPIRMATFIGCFAINFSLLFVFFILSATDVHLNCVLGEIFGTLAPNPGCFQVSRNTQTQIF